MRLAHRRHLIAGAISAVLAVAVGGIATSAHAATGCRVTYTVSSQWPGGFGANVAVTNLGDPISSWRLTWSFAAGQQITQLWNGSASQTGTQVAVANAAWNGSLATGSSASFGFNGTWNDATNPAPTDFVLNGAPCTGSTIPSGSPSAPNPPTPSATPTPTPSTTPSVTPSVPNPPTPSTTPGDLEPTIVPDPSWTCNMPTGIVPPTRGRLVLRVAAQLGAIREVGATQYGHRRLLDVTGGSFVGERLSGTVLTGGLDLELTLTNGAVEVEQINVLRAADGTLIYLRSCGVAPSGDAAVRIVPDFEAPSSSPYAWLNTGTFVGARVLDTATNTVELTVYDVSGVSPTEPRIQLTDPAGLPHQSWNCATGGGTRGASVFTASVTLGSSLAVGASKRGTRTIIPITGGTISGRVAGSILAGGADYQLSGSTTTLDARYTLSTSDGELILVRNCGAFGRLVPTFEARAAGPYAFLNANTWLSSDPGFAPGGVSITFYERR
ncbi:DUF3237 family protein [Solwaraspora sp. WMMB762]|uniref:DUF3237 family protein n=1 Tax=Solwaraspora sp. WMMB762 TaxID=3404120 RepID=UPI003B934AF7